MTIYVAEIFGRGVVAFDAESDADAQALLAERPLRRDLIVLQNEGRPLWDGVSKIQVRTATSSEAETCRASRAASVRSSRSPTRSGAPSWSRSSILPRENSTTMTTMTMTMTAANEVPDIMVGVWL